MAGSLDTTRNWLCIGVSVGLLTGLGLHFLHWRRQQKFFAKSAAFSGACKRIENDSSLSSGSPDQNRTPTSPGHTSVDGSPLRAFAVRFLPGQELKSGLLEYVRERNLAAAVVVTCVGSLESATLRLAGATSDNCTTPDVKLTRNERFEIVSLVGTLSASHGCHLHCSLADAEGHVWGGHCVGDMVVHTTAEVVLADCQGLAFERHFDGSTGFKELAVLCGPVSQ